MRPITPHTMEEWDRYVADPPAGRRDLFRRLMEESRVRGVHAFGVCQDGELSRSHSLPPVVDQMDPTRPLVAHCRYSTSGDWRDLHNCQPIRVRHYALAFNGVIDMGTKQEMEKRWDVTLESDNDGEIFLRRLLSGQDAGEFVDEISGSFAGVWIDFRQNRMYAGRNARRPLWVAKQHSAVWYFSTRDIGLRAGIAREKIREVGTFGIECCTHEKIYGMEELRG